MTVSNNFQPFAQRSRWQETHHRLFFLTSHHYRHKQNYNKPALWTSPSSAQLCFLHFIMSGFGVAPLEKPEEEKVGTSPPTLEHCRAWGSRSLGSTHTFCSSTCQQTHCSRLFLTSVSDFPGKKSLFTSSMYLGTWEPIGLFAFWSGVYSKHLLKAKIYPFKPDDIKWFIKTLSSNFHTSFTYK